MLDNAARPSGALVFNGGDGRMSEDQFDRLKHELAESHAGPANAGRPMLLEGGLDWKSMALSLGLPGDNTYANYREANLAFWRQTVSPLSRKMARALAVWLRPWFGPDLTIEADESGVPGLKELEQ